MPFLYDSIVKFLFWDQHVWHSMHWAGRNEHNVHVTNDSFYIVSFHIVSIYRKELGFEALVVIWSHSLPLLSTILTLVYISDNEILLCWITVRVVFAKWLPMGVSWLFRVVIGGRRKEKEKGSDTGVHECHMWYSECVPSLRSIAYCIRHALCLRCNLLFFPFEFNLILITAAFCSNYLSQL